MKRKIINDPVYGFINLESDLAFEIIDHPYFQRLRNIRQLGMTYFIYPGATHSRFEHALGAAHLMKNAIETLRGKGNSISKEEEEAAIAAILMHDMGHGPFSHALEATLIKGISHERISLLLMKELNSTMNGRLDLAIQIYKDQYPKKYLHQLVNSHLDVDRLDYLKRDSFYTGVTEGTVGSDRIIKMMNISNGELVVEEKGIYSIEKFLIARRLMYWQVYLHKTVLSAEIMIINILKRAKELALKGEDIIAVPALQSFLYSEIDEKQFGASCRETQQKTLHLFTSLDDHDIISAIKQWQYHPDNILSFLAGTFINRQLFKLKMSGEPFSEKKKEKMRQLISEQFNVIDGDEMDYLLIHQQISNSTYAPDKENKINLLLQNGKIRDLSTVSEINFLKLNNTDHKYFLAVPRLVYQK